MPLGTAFYLGPITKIEFIDGTHNSESTLEQGQSWHYTIRGSPFVTPFGAFCASLFLCHEVTSELIFARLSASVILLTKD
jgi:hypothetical protein